MRTPLNTSVSAPWLLKAAKEQTREDVVLERYRGRLMVGDCGHGLYRLAGTPCIPADGATSEWTTVARLPVDQLRELQNFVDRQASDDPAKGALQGIHFDPGEGVVEATNRHRLAVCTLLPANTEEKAFIAQRAWLRMVDDAAMRFYGGEIAIERSLIHVRALGVIAPIYTDVQYLDTRRFEAVAGEPVEHAHVDRKAFKSVLAKVRGEEYVRVWADADAGLVVNDEAVEGSRASGSTTHRLVNPDYMYDALLAMRRSDDIKVALRGPRHAVSLHTDRGRQYIAPLDIPGLTAQR